MKKQLAVTLLALFTGAAANAQTTLGSTISNEAMPGTSKNSVTPKTMRHGKWTAEQKMKHDQMMADKKMKRDMMTQDTNKPNP